MNSLRSGKTIGIDLGTTFSSLAYVDPQGLPRVVGDAAGRTTLPSAVYFDDLGVVVGHEALRRASLHAERVVQFVKLNMGEAWTREYHGHIHTPESISALVLKQLVSEAEARIGPIDDAVITVPAYFTERRRRATQQAGEIAGLNVVGMLNEPMAAALAYGLFRSPGERNIVVYDLGGGTFDVTVVRVSPDRIEEMAILGNRQLGGCDWDRCLIDFVADDYRGAHGDDPRNDKQAMMDMQIACEAAKKQLSRQQQAAVMFKAFQREHVVEITRACFESRTEHLVETTRMLTESAVADAGLGWDQIERVVMVGGSTLMPSIRTMVRKISGKTPDTSVNPLLAVSLGAAVFAQMLDRNTAFEAVPTIILEDPVDATEPSPEIVPTVIPKVTEPLLPSVQTPASPKMEPPLLVAEAVSDREGPSPPPVQKTRPWSDKPHIAPAAESETDTDKEPNLSEDPAFPPTIAFVPAQHEERPHLTSAEPASERLGVFRQPRLPSVRFVTAHGVGVLLKRGDDDINAILIPKNSPVPVRTSRTFRTTSSTSAQTNVRVTITQGDTTDAELTEVLGVGRIVGLPAGCTANRPVDVVLEFDQQGRLHVHAVYIDTGDRLDMTINVAAGLKPEVLASHREFVASIALLSAETSDEIAEDFVFIDPEDDDL